MPEDAALQWEITKRPFEPANSDVVLTDVQPKTALQDGHSSKLTFFFKRHKPCREQSQNSSRCGTEMCCESVQMFLGFFMLLEHWSPRTPPASSPSSPAVQASCRSPRKELERCMVQRQTGVFARTPHP